MRFGTQSSLKGVTNTMNELQHVLDRIPKRWGRYLSVYSGWHELIK
jgi:hypothetical protein